MARYDFDPDFVEIGMNIKAARKKKGWTQEDLAAEMKTDRANISKYENGAKMTLVTFNRFCEVLEVSAGQLSTKKLNNVSDKRQRVMAAIEDFTDADLDMLLVNIDYIKKLKEQGVAH